MAKKIWGGKKITEIIKDVQEKQGRINLLLGEFQETATKVKNTVAEIDQMSKTVSDNATNIEGVLSEARDSKDEIQKLREEVARLQSSTQELIESNKKLLDESKEQLAVIAGGSLSNTFEKRRVLLNESASKWKNWLLGDIVALVIVAIIIFLELKSNQSLTTGFFLKFSFSFPFIYAAFFFHGQYSKERELEEEYAFKSAVSFSLDAYRKLLNEEIDDEKSDERARLLDFITSTVEKIYSPPINNIKADKSNNGSPETLDKIREIFENIVNLTKRS